MVSMRVVTIGTMVATNTKWTLQSRMSGLLIRCSLRVVILVYASKNPTRLLKRTAASYLVLSRWRWVRASLPTTRHIRRRAEFASYYDSLRSSTAASTGNASGASGPHRMDSVRSFATASTRATMETDTMVEIPRDSAARGRRQR